MVSCLNEIKRSIIYHCWTIFKNGYLNVVNGNSVLQITRSNTIATMASNNKDCMKKNSNKD